VAVCFFGEGALGQGVLYEEMNLAQLWGLPVIYACENNMYNEYTHFSESTAGELLGRPAAFGIPAEAVDGQDVRAVYAAASKYVDRARAGGGPGFLLLNTYRYHGHHVGDVATLRAIYRPKTEEELWMTERDPIRLHAERLVAEGVTDQAALDRVKQELTVLMDAAMEFGINAPFPDTDKVDQDIYA
jgi:pyruvate dehydrogenase E1 component alpha subunit